MMVMSRSLVVHGSHSRIEDRASDGTQAGRGPLPLWIYPMALARLHPTLEPHGHPIHHRFEIQ
jgi:hypothetical protein